MMCKCGWHIISKINTTIECPMCRESLEVFAEIDGEAQSNPYSPQEQWRELHEYPFSVVDWVPELALESYNNWRSRIRNYGCQCKDEWRKLEDANPISKVIHDRLQTFLWGVDRHNEINQKLGKPRMSHHEARLTYDLYYAINQPEALTPRNERAIVSVAFGSHLPTLKQTHPARAAYAKSIGADLIELTDDRWPKWPMANKWRVHNILEMYESVLYVDSDIHIKPCPNIFQAVPTGFLGVCNELPQVQQNGEIGLGYIAQLNEHCDRHGVPACWSPNAGVLVIPHNLLNVYKAPRVVAETQWCFDQYELVVQCHKLNAPVHILDDKWNWGWIRQDWWNGLDNAHFIHVNGSGSGNYRTKLLDRIIAGNYERFIPQEGWVPLWKPA